MNSATLALSPSSLCTQHDFIIAVYVNDREFGRGRGGTKSSAKQDAARRAVRSLMPGVAFDANGIIVDLGGGRSSFSDAEMVAHLRTGGAATAPEDLAPNLASRLAIDGTPSDERDNYATHDGRTSPAPSDADSSISTAVSTPRCAHSVVVTGVPPGSSRRDARKPNVRIYPCASTTTSAASSASENERNDKEDDVYYASRGASVCTALLHAMAQIDPQIREPPAYTFDLCANPASAAVPITSVGPASSEGKSAKRKGAAGGCVGAIASKRRSATTAVGTNVTVHSPRCAHSVVVTGIPPGSSRRDARKPNVRIYPCASTTTSAASSASENERNDKEDDVYYASRGASVCTALLHAMAQIDPQIREPPAYTFDLCANPASAAVPITSVGPASSEGKSAKRKGAAGGCVGAIASKRRSATTAVGTNVTVHRSTFACTASLVLHLSKIVSEGASDRSIPESDAKVTSAGGDERDDKHDSEYKHGGKMKYPPYEGNDGCSPESDNETINRVEEPPHKKLEAAGTGATKREARHTASARLLALLFPDCEGMAEVKAAAEAARERYAAKKALTRQSMRALSLSGVVSGGSGEGVKGKKATSRREGDCQNSISGSSSPRILSSSRGKGDGAFACSFPRDDDPPIPNSVIQQIEAVTGSKVNHHRATTTTVKTPPIWCGFRWQW